MTDDNLPKPLQENILTLAIHNDTACKLIRATVPINLFTSRTYREIMSRIYDYVDLYGVAPRDHLADELDEFLREDSEEANLVGQILLDAEKLRGTLNTEYVLDQLHKFVRQQSLKVAIIDAHEKVQRGELDAAEEVLQRGMRNRAETFDPGVTLPDVVRQLKDKPELRDPIATGIKELDRLALGCARGELQLFIGPPKRGKSWWLVHMTRRALMQRWKGVYITLELSARFVGRRIVQSIGGMTTREIEKLPQTVFSMDQKGGLEAIEHRMVHPRYLLHPRSLNLLQDKLAEIHYEGRLYIKEFAPKALTLNALEAYLDLLIDAHGFSPDFVALDYPNLMKLNIDNYRLELGDLILNLRRLAVERNMAMMIVHQSNRVGAGAPMVDERDVAEDFSLIATADSVLTYSQTRLEREWNLARLFVSNARTEVDRFVILLTQNYATGQFVLQSHPMEGAYEDILKELSHGPDEDTERSDR